MTRARFENGKRVIAGWNRVFRAMSAEPRRQIVVSLMDAPPDQSVSLPESATNPNVPVDSESLRAELYHRHLPMLAEMEYVDWDSDPLVASRGSRFEEVAAVFEALHSNAGGISDELVVGCQRLEREREFGRDE